MTNPQHSSESNEHFTPMAIIEAAHELMGGIDLDPASCEAANRLVLADRYYSLEDPGHAQQWGGRVFLNPPGGVVDAEWRPVYARKGDRPPCAESGACGLPPGHSHMGLTSSAKKWWYKLVREWVAGRVTQAIFVGFSLEILQSAQGEDHHGPLHFPICVPATRMRFLRPGGTTGEYIEGAQPTHANVIVYLSDGAENAQRFAHIFSRIGAVKI